MKLLFALAPVCLLAGMVGCSTSRTAGQARSKGETHIFDAPFEQVWMAALATAQQTDMIVLASQKNQGFISAKHWHFPGSGEDTHISITPLSAEKTRVAVITRDDLAAVPNEHGWQMEILRTMDAHLDPNYEILSKTQGSGSGITESGSGGTEPTVATVEAHENGPAVKAAPDEDVSVDELLQRERARRAQEVERARLRREQEMQKLQQYLEQQEAQTRRP